MGEITPREAWSSDLRGVEVGGGLEVRRQENGWGAFHVLRENERNAYLSFFSDSAAGVKFGSSFRAAS